MGEKHEGNTEEGDGIDEERVGARRRELVEGVRMKPAGS